jgi:hypothetical protein
LAHGEPTPELRLDYAREVLNEVRAVFGPILTALLLSEDTLAEFPVHQHALKVNTPGGCVPCLRDDVLDVTVKIHAYVQIAELFSYAAHGRRLLSFIATLFKPLNKRMLIR